MLYIGLEYASIDGTLNGNGGKTTPITVNNALAMLIPIATNIEEVLLKGLDGVHTKVTITVTSIGTAIVTKILLEIELGPVTKVTIYDVFASRIPASGT